MPNCPICGREVSEEQKFCPNCGVDLKTHRLPSRRRTAEKAEKREKQEKREKAEKHEKREVSPVVPLVGGMILILAGVIFFLDAWDIISLREAGPYFLVLLGLIIIVAAVYASITASKRSPRP